MITLYVARHGETKGNIENRLMGQSDSILTESGLRQAKVLGEKIRNIKIDAVYSSDLERAHRTACIICDEAGLALTPVKTEKIREIDVGKLSGVDTNIFLKKYSPQNDLEYSFPDGESYKKFYERIAGFLSELGKKHDSQTVLMVAHEGVIKAVEYHFGQLDLKKYSRIKIPHECLGKFTIEDGKLRKRLFL